MSLSPQIEVITPKGLHRRCVIVFLAKIQAHEPVVKARTHLKNKRTRLLRASTSVHTFHTRGCINTYLHTCIWMCPHDTHAHRHTPVLFSESVTSSCSYWNPLLHNQATKAGKAMIGLFSTLSCVISVALLTLSKHISDISDRDGSQHSKQSTKMLLRKEKTRQ